MKFQVERDVLAEAVGWVSRALPARPVIPVLSGLLLQAADGLTDGGLTLSCFDYEVSARAEVGAEVAEPGTVLVPGRLLAEITRSLPSLPVEFADDPDGVSLTCGSASFTLVTLPVEEYPDLPVLSLIAGTVDGGDLAAAVGQVAPAASRDDTLPLLTGVNLEVQGETMTLAATDRYRLAVRDLAWSPGRPDVSGSYLVPARTLVDAARTMAPGVPVTVWLRSDRDRDTELAREYGDASPAPGVSPASHAPGPADPGPGVSPASRAADAMIGFESGGRRVTTRLIAGEYIKYRSRFPAEFACRADMPAAPFIEAVRRVSLVAERGSAVRLTFGGGEVTVEAETQGRARAREIVRADFRGVEPGIAFSPHFLLDGIAAAGVSAAAPDPSAPDPAAAAPDPAAPAGNPAVAASDRAVEASDPAVAVSNPAQTGSADPAGPAGPKPPSSRRRRAAPAHDAAADASPGAAGPADGLIRLEFNSSTKAAVLTGVRAPAPGSTEAGSTEAGTAPARPPSPDGPPTPPDFRYLVVPLRQAGRQ
jgi:DNA polymerase-3 subunit beta